MESSRLSVFASSLADLEAGIGDEENTKKTDKEKKKQSSTGEGKMIEKRTNQERTTHEDDEEALSGSIGDEDRDEQNKKAVSYRSVKSHVRHVEEKRLEAINLQEEKNAEIEKDRQTRRRSTVLDQKKKTFGRKESPSSRSPLSPPSLSPSSSHLLSSSQRDVPPSPTDPSACNVEDHPERGESERRRSSRKDSSSVRLFPHLSPARGEEIEEKNKKKRISSPGGSSPSEVVVFERREDFHESSLSSSISDQDLQSNDEGASKKKTDVSSTLPPPPPVVQPARSVQTGERNEEIQRERGRSRQRSSEEVTSKSEGREREDGNESRERNGQFKRLNSQVCFATDTCDKNHDVHEERKRFSSSSALASPPSSGVHTPSREGGYQHRPLSSSDIVAIEMGDLKDDDERAKEKQRRMLSNSASNLSSASKGRTRDVPFLSHSASVLTTADSQVCRVRRGRDDDLAVGEDPEGGSDERGGENKTRGGRTSHSPPGSPSSPTSLRDQESIQKGDNRDRRRGTGSGEGANGGWEMSLRRWYLGGGAEKLFTNPFLDKKRPNPTRGRLLITYTSSAVLILVFLQELILNFTTFNGRCISPVLYPSFTDPLPDRAPLVVPFGYGACEHNLGGEIFPHSKFSSFSSSSSSSSSVISNSDLYNEQAEDRKTHPQDQRDYLSASSSSSVREIERCANGTCAGDTGWPKHLVTRGNSGHTEYSAPWDSPNPRIFGTLGGLDTNKIRNYRGEVFRVFWSMNLHGGWIHLLVNLICQVQILWIIEPVWGFLRTLLLWFVSGVSGNLMSAVLDPCTITVGSSGALYGLIGALLPFSLEYWDYIASPAWLLFSVILLMVLAQLGNMWGLRGVDNYAHLGGCLAGLLFGFMTIRSIHAFRWQGITERMASSCLFSWCFSTESREKLRDANRRRIARARRQRRLSLVKPPRVVWKFRGHEMEWLIRSFSFLLLTAYWIGFWLCLMVPSLYERITDPPGSFSLSGAVGCHCCRVKPYPLDKLPRYHSIRANEGLYWCFTSSHIADLYCGRKPLMMLKHQSLSKQEESVSGHRPASPFIEDRGDDSSASFSPTSPQLRDIRRGMKNRDKTREGEYENRDTRSKTRNLSAPTSKKSRSSSPSDTGVSSSSESVGFSPGSSLSLDENLRLGNSRRLPSEMSDSGEEREERRKKLKDDQDDSPLVTGNPSSSSSPENSNSPLSWLGVLGGDLLKDLYERFTSYGSPSRNEEDIAP
ncbi:rhomboid protease rom5 [Cystoisospora suis]|uniref:Rhomboid-like protease n=1 Tax=Cystoisospora suis TaxID=483139 RepID=A0A2C6L017_9APIC|nr:rhomboid protease rom5 [Cystoisospora suis]